MPLPPYTGGIASFLNALSDSPSFREIRAGYVNTYTSERVRNSRLLRALASLRFFAALVLRLLTFRYRLVHLNSSAGSSFFEKSFLTLER